MHVEIRFKLVSGVWTMDGIPTEATYERNRDLIHRPGRRNPQQLVLEANEDPQEFIDRHAVLVPGVSFVFDDGGTILFESLPEIQRKTLDGEVTRDGTSAQSVFATPLQSVALPAGDQQLTIAFEMKMEATAANQGAEASLTVNSNERYRWVWPYNQYHTFGVTVSQSVTEGATPIFDLLLNRIGGNGNVFIRRVSMTLRRIGGAIVSDDE